MGSNVKSEKNSFTHRAHRAGNLAKKFLNCEGCLEARRICAKKRGLRGADADVNVNVWNISGHVDGAGPTVHQGARGA